MVCNFITCSFLKKKLQYRCFPEIFAKFFRVIFNPQLSEALVRKCSVKRLFLTVSQKSQENTCVNVPFLIKLKASGLQLYLKIDSDTGVFLWILWNLLEQLFYRTPVNDFFESLVVFFKFFDKVSIPSKCKIIKIHLN